MKAMFTKCIHKLLHDKNGLSPFGPIFIMIIILGIGAVTNEIVRYAVAYDNFGTELNRAVNVSVKEAMYDSYRQDITNKLDEDVAENAFYEYLTSSDVLNLTKDGKNTYSKITDGERDYTIEIDSLKIDGENARMIAEGTVYIEGMFTFLDDVQLPFTVRSRNMRIDNY